MSVHIVERIAVAAPPAAVFAAVTDWPGQREWIFATNTRASLGTGRDTGDEISAFTGFGPIGFTDTMTITEWDPPRRCRVRHTGRVVRGTAVFEVVPAVGGTSEFLWQEDLDLPFGVVGRLGFAATRPVFTYFVRRSLRRFARWAVERG